MQSSHIHLLIVGSFIIAYLSVICNCFLKNERSLDVGTIGISTVVEIKATRRIGKSVCDAVYDRETASGQSGSGMS